MNIILFLLFAAIRKLCRVLLSSPDLTPRTQKTETVVDEPPAEEPSPPNESTESETVSRRKKPKYVRIICIYICLYSQRSGSTIEHPISRRANHMVYVHMYIKC